VLPEEGGIGAALSEESMRRQKYCRQWLQHALVHIDGQILSFWDFIVSLQSAAKGSISPEAPVSLSHLRILTDIRNDVVHTIRQVGDVVSRYAGTAVTKPAHSRVREFLLHLSQQWASAMQGLSVESSRPGVSLHKMGSAAEAASSSSVAGGATRRGIHAMHTQHRGRGTAAPARPRTVRPMSIPCGKPKSIAGAGGRAGAGGTGRASDCWYGADFDAHDGGLGYDAWYNGGCG